MVFFYKFKVKIGVIKVILAFPLKLMSVLLSIFCVTTTNLEAFLE